MGSIQMPGRNGQQAASAHAIIRGQSKREWAEKSRTSWRSGQEREVCHCRTRKAPPTNPVPHLWQVEFLPVNISSPFIWPFVGGWARHSQPSGWGKIQTEWGDSMKTPSCLASSEPTTSPLATVCGLAPFVQEERKILEDYSGKARWLVTGSTKRWGSYLWADSSCPQLVSRVPSTTAL